MNFVSSAKIASRRVFAIAAAAVLACMLSVVAVFAVFSTQAQAQPNPEYSYTVRIYAGTQGSFNGADSIVVTDNAKPGDICTFNQSSITLDNGSKYYIRGVKLSGRDNDESLPAFKITGDTDLVVTYGVLGDNVAYTVRYVDTDGNELLPSETFYGNVGDSPVIAFRYIEGYTPQAYNLTGKLLANADKNVYTFTYTSTENAENPETPTPQPAIVAPVPGEGDQNPVAAVVPQADIPDDANPLAGGDDQPADMQDIRDNDNPLALFEKLLGDEASLITFEDFLPIIGFLGCAIILAIGLLLFFRKRRKDQQRAYQAARAEVFSNNGRNGSSNSGSSENGSGGNGRTV